MGWNISKAFEFDYGHRVWTQEPDAELSCGHQSVCRHLHGHRGTVHVHLESDSLNEQGMVTDFVNLNWFKKFLDDALDHKMVLDINDPLLKHMFPLVGRSLKAHRIDDFITHWTLHTLDYFDQPNEVKEIYEGLVLVEFVPTSENLSWWLLNVVQVKMEKIGVKVSHIEFLETPKSKSVYYGN